MRVYQTMSLKVGSLIELDEQASHHVARVLRARLHDSLTVFNGQGGEYRGTICHIGKKHVSVELHEYSDQDVESPLDLCLAQSISRGEKMDFTIQKAVELGVKKIIPLFTERCNVHLDSAKSKKRLQHWQSIIISACEQCGRNQLPDIELPLPLKAAFPLMKGDACFVLSPNATQTISSFALQKKDRIVLLVGPEGGLSGNEIELAKQHQFSPLFLGPRVLRTETAALAALSLFQFYVGDMG